LGTLGLRVIELFAMYATDGQTGRWTDGQKQSLPPSTGGGIIMYEVGTLAVDGRAVTFGTARRAAARPGPSSLYQM